MEEIFSMQFFEKYNWDGIGSKQKKAIKNLGVIDILKSIFKTTFCLFRIRRGVDY